MGEGSICRSVRDDALGVAARAFFEVITLSSCEGSVHVTLTVLLKASCNVFHQMCQKRSGRTVKSEVRCILGQ